MNETGRFGLGAAVTGDGKSTKPNKAAPEPPLASDGLVTWSLVGNQKQESIKSTIHEDDGIRAIEASFGQEDKRKPVDLGDFQDGGKYRSIVKIQSRWGNEKTETWTMGTGWLVREDIVVTAGHNVFSATHKCQASRIKCWIGYHGDSFIDESSVQHRSALNVVTTESWLRQHRDRERRDLALIQVDKAFTGNLRLFKYINTPTAKKEGTIVVVGYPGDKHPETLAGETGQSGAPILLSDHNGTVVIGTHCYGGTGGNVNSGSPIGGQYGNNYDEFIKRVELSKREEPHRRAAFSQNDFCYMLRYIEQIDPYAIEGNSALGPVGHPMGTIAGGIIGILSATAGTPGERGFVFPSRDSIRACIYRAQLAESALQCVLQLHPSRERSKIMFNMHKYWIEHPSWLHFEFLGEYDIQTQLSPIFNDFGVRLALSQWQKGVHAKGQEPLELKGFGVLDWHRRGDVLLAFLFRARTRFVHSDHDATVQSRGAWLSELLRMAIRVAKPIVSEPASGGLYHIARAMGWWHRHRDWTPDRDLIDGGMGRILWRAVVADTALQVLEDMKFGELGFLSDMPSGTVGERVLENLMTIVQQMGQRTTSIAEDTMVTQVFFYY